MQRAQGWEYNLLLSIVKHSPMHAMHVQTHERAQKPQHFFN